VTKPKKRKESALGNNTATLDKKAIKVSIIKQFEAKYSGYRRLKRKAKREILKGAINAAEKSIKSGDIDVPVLTEEERLGLDEIPEGIMNLEEMADFIDDHERSVISLPNRSRMRYIKNPLLKYIDGLLDDALIDRILATPGMTPSMRDWMPSQLLRMEILRTIVFPDFGSRGFCKYIENLDRKEERAFCRLSLRSNEMCSHSMLSAFRSSLTFEMRTNLMVYILHHFNATGRVGDRTIHMIDSTDVAIPINTAPLAKLKISNKNYIRFYSDLDCDCGTRRNKRDKSKMFVGYRVHTLCVADIETGIAFPLLSFTIAANHHDSQVLNPVLSLAKTIGIEIKVLSADEAYANENKQEELLEKEDIFLVTPPKGKTKIPEQVDKNDGSVFFDGACETPMQWYGYDKEDSGHIFVCGDENGNCLRKNICNKERMLPIDTGFFGPIPKCVSESDKAIEMRKITERPFNLLKHHDGLEPCAMKTKRTVTAQVMFSQMVGVFKVMAGTRSVPKSKDEKRQEVLPIAANG